MSSYEAIEIDDYVYIFAIKPISFYVFKDWVIYILT